MKNHNRTVLKITGTDQLIKSLVLLVAVSLIFYKPVLELMIKVLKKMLGERSFEIVERVSKKVFESTTQPAMEGIVFNIIDGLMDSISAKLTKITKAYIAEKRKERKNAILLKALDRGYELQLKKHRILEYFKFQNDAGNRYEDQIQVFKSLGIQGEIYYKRSYSRVETRLLTAIDVAIEQYEETGDSWYYIKFTQALNAYYEWLDRRIFKVTLELRYLRKLLVRKGLSIDLRKKIRTMLRFLFKNLDDYHRLGNTITQELQRFYYWLKGNNHEYNIYRTNY